MQQATFDTRPGAIRNRHGWKPWAIGAALAAFAFPLPAAETGVTVQDAQVVVEETGSFDLPFPVQRSGDTTDGVRMRVQTAPGGTNPGVPGDDYTPLLPGTEVLLQPGQTETTIDVEVFGQSAGTPDRTLLLQLAEAHAFNLDPRFANAGLNLPVHGALSNALRLADLNGNGVRDIVTGNDLSLNVSVLLSNAGGSFETAETYPVTPPDGVGEFPHTVRVALGDVTGNGHTDLVATGYNKQVIDILEGDGRGGFTPLAPLPLGSADYQTAVTLADVNNDGDLDILLAITNYEGAGNNISMLLSDGSGGFLPLQSHALEQTPLSITPADVTNNGHVDLVIGTTEVVLLPGQGNGDFGPAQTFSAGDLVGGVLQVVLADVTDDGHPDLVTANRMPEQPPFTMGSVSVLPGDGTGNFTEAQQYAQGPGAILSVVVGEVTGSGHPDILYTRPDDRGFIGDHVGLLVADGDGGFAAPVQLPSGISPSVIALGEVTGDGFVDAVITNAGGANVSILPGDGDGGLGLGDHYDVGRFPHSIAGTDLDGDGRPDMVTANAQGHTVSVLLNDGDGGFAPATMHPTGLGPNMVRTADMDGDGIPDLITSNGAGGSVSVLPGDGTGGFAPAQDYSTGGPLNQPSALAVGDIDGDGHLDVVTANSVIEDGGASVDTVSVLLGEGDGGLVEPSIIDMGSAQSLQWIALADLDGDGHLDVLTAHSQANRVAMLAGDGQGSFGEPAYLAAGQTPAVATAADVTGDDLIDLVVLNHGEHTVSIFPGDGGGGFTDPATYPIFPETGCSFGDDAICPWAWDLAVADVTGDGRPDLITANTDNHTVTVLVNDGSGGFSNYEYFHTGTNPRSLTVSDFDGDGNSDVATANSRANSISVLRNRMSRVVLEADEAIGTIHFGEEPELEFDPVLLDFGEIALGSTSPPQLTVLHNTGTADAEDLAFTPPGNGMSTDTGDCGEVLAAGDNCNVSVAFAPVEPGPVDVIMRAASSGGASAVVRMIGNGVEPDEYALDVQVSGQGSVQVEPDLPGYEPGQVVTLTALPDPGWNFAGWGGDAAGIENPISLTIQGDTTVTAMFEPAEYTLDLEIDGQGGVQLEPDQPGYQFGDEITLTATPDPGWTFVQWTGNFSMPAAGNSSTDNPLTVVVTANLAIQAEFQPAGEGDDALPIPTLSRGALLFLVLLVMGVTGWRLRQPTSR